MTGHVRVPALTIGERYDERSPQEAAAWRHTEETLRKVAMTVCGPDYRAIHFFARDPSI